MPASSSDSVCSASRRRSVLKMLNSVSSAVNALPLSGVSSASPFPPSSKPAALTPPNASIASPSSSRSAVKSCDDLQRRGERRDRDEVGGRQLLVDVVVRRVHRALHLFRLHRAQVEEQHDEPAAVHVDLGGRRAGGRRLPRASVGRRGPATTGRSSPAPAASEASSAVEPVELLEVEARDRLRLVVLGDAEVVPRQTAHDRAVLVAHDDVDEDELGAGAKHRRRLRRRLRVRRYRQGSHEQKKPQSAQRSQRRIFSQRAPRTPRFLLRRHHQNLNRNSSCTRRIGRTDVT